MIEATQTEPGGTFDRNDRLIAVAEKTKDHEGVTRLSQLGDSLLEQIEHFFRSYNDYDGKTFDVERRSGARRARRLVDEGARRATKPKVKP